MRTDRSISLVPFLIGLVGCAGLPPVDLAASGLPGRYEDWTQSDWTLALDLAPDGSAVLEYTWWDAGSGKTELRHKSATWKRRGSGILLRYDRVKDTLAWRSRLRDEDGNSRGEGFESVAPIDPKSIIGGSRLWLVAEPANRLDPNRKHGRKDPGEHPHLEQRPEQRAASARTNRR